MSQMTEDSNLNLSSLSFARSVGIESLPEAVVLQIIRDLDPDLGMVASLSWACPLFRKVACSDDLWRVISRTIVGPWIHRKSPQDPPVPADWTLDKNCFPTSHIESSKQPADVERFNSWHQFATRFLIPNFVYFGWHISSRSNDCQLVLVTYDVFSGQLSFEQVKCVNKFQPILARPEEPAVLGLPPWVPINRVHLEPGGLGYRISPEIDLQNQGFKFEIFKPAYSTSLLYNISATEVLKDRFPSTKTILPLKIFTLENYKKNVKIKHADKIVAPRSNITLRKVLKQSSIDLVTDPGSGKQIFPSFKLSQGPDRRDCYAINAPIAYHLYQPSHPREIFKGLWVGIAGGVHRGNIHFGKVIEEIQCNSHCQMRFLRLTGGQPEFVWEVGISHGRPFPVLSLDEAIASDFGTSRVDGGLQGLGKIVAGHQWQGITVQFINGPDASLNGLNINQIRVKWSLDEVVTDYYKVEFYS